MRIKHPHFFEDVYVQMWTWTPINIRTSEYLDLALTSICWEKYSLVHLRMADFASGRMNDRFCNDKLNYMY